MGTRIVSPDISKTSIASFQRLCCKKIKWSSTATNFTTLIVTLLYCVRMVIVVSLHHLRLLILTIALSPTTDKVYVTEELF